jgi:CubicO group peptidase (beta-lactamase class C family)
MKALTLKTGLCSVALAACVSCSHTGDDLPRWQFDAGEPIPDELLASSMQRHDVPGVSIAVIRRGEIDWTRGYGVRMASGEDAVDSTTLFQAASISKPVTAAGALRLVEASALALDENVNQKLRSWKLPENEFTSRQPVTLRCLLSHSAGLTVHGFPGYAEGADLPTLVQILDGDKPANTASIRVDTEPGKEFRYSGGGYTVVQQLMIDATDQSFPQLMHELVLRPTGMMSSTYEQPLPKEWRSRAAVGHTGDGKPLEGEWHTYPELGAAGLWTTPTDLALFAIEVWRSYHGMSEMLLPQRLTRMMLARQIGDYGLGFSLPSAGVLRFQHGGGNAGYRCLLVLTAESGDGVVIMTNGDSGEALISEIFSAIAAAYGWYA